MRLEGWESRLVAVVDAARDVPYQLGQHDCFRLACAVVLALTGVDKWPLFAGRYSTRGEAVRHIARFGSSFEEAAAAFFAGETAPARLGRRGDLCAYTDGSGEKHLAVCMGDRVAALGESGLVWLPLRACHACWRIG